MFFAYPCGCIGLGCPPEPITEKQIKGGPAASLTVTWADVVVVSPCDRDEHWEPGGLAPRLLQGRKGGGGPEPLPEGHPAVVQFWEANRKAHQDARRWRNLRRGLAPLLNLKGE